MTAITQLSLFLQPEERADDLPTMTVTRCQSGDLWQLGRHRLLCADCTDSQQVKRLLVGVVLDAHIADPPYNVGVQYRGFYAGQDNKPAKVYGKWLRTAIEEINPFLKPGAVVFIWQAMANIHHFSSWFAGYDWRLFASCKNFVQLHRGGWLEHAWEPVVCWTHGPRKARSITRDWHIALTSNTKPTPDRKIRAAHPCPRPLDTLEWLIGEAVPLGGYVVDTFLGSGTTLLACEQTGRVCYGMEIEPFYADIVLTRWEKATGQQSILLDRQS